MFLYHSELALKFLLSFLNDAFEKNYKIRSLKTEDGEAKNVSFSFDDGSVKNYFGCYEYWVMYRGTNSRNRLITSLLMALEKAMLDLADISTENYSLLKSYISRMIQETNNVAVIGVISSVIQAHPDLMDEVSVYIFGVPIFFKWDASRYSNELINLRNYSDDPFLNNERIFEDNRSHRKKYHLGLVGFVKHYMFFHQTCNKQLFRQVDEMWKTIPKNDTLWKKFLFDMDARKYSFKTIDQPGYDNMVQLLPGYDSEVEKILLPSSNKDWSIPSIGKVWASNVFKGEEVNDKTYEAWKSGYDHIIAMEGKNIWTAPGTMAAIGLRDFLESLLPEEMNWCQEELIRYGKNILKPEEELEFGIGMTDDNEALTGISLIFNSDPSKSIAFKAKELIFKLLISRLEEKSKISLEFGLTQYLSKTQPEFLIHCWFGLLTFIDNISVIKQNHRNQNLIDPWYNILPEDSNEWEVELINSVINGTIETPSSIHISLQINTHFFITDALRIIPFSTKMQLQHDFINLFLNRHIELLTNPSHRRHSNYYEDRHAFKFFYSRFILSQPQKLGEKYFTVLLALTSLENRTTQTEELVEFLYDTIKEFIFAVNTGLSVSNFWELWDLLKQWMISQKDPYLMPLFLMEINWNASSEKWHVLKGKNIYYQDFILDYGFNKINTTVKFLSGISFYNFMPESISWCASMLKSNNADDLDIKIADEFIQKSFYNFGDKIKGSKILLQNFIFILDFMIRKKSTKAYMLKEELIQYKKVD